MAALSLGAVKRAHIVIGFTPYHSLFAERLIDHLGSNVFCLFTKRWPETKTEYHRLGFFFKGGKIFRKVSYLISFVYFAMVIKWKLVRGVQVEVYAPHPDNIFSNYLFLSNKSHAVHIYEDGLLNYYDAPVGQFKVGLLLRMTALICGMPYTRYSGHFAGYDAASIKSVFLSFGQMAVAKKKIGEIVVLPGIAKSIKPVKGRILFLDQYVDNYLKPMEREFCLEYMLSHFPRHEYEYFYKAHHDYGDYIDGMRLLKKEWRQLPAEMVVPKLLPEIVVSFYSSALMNIAAIYPAVRCISIAACFVPITRDEAPCRLSEIFAEAGVKILYPDLRGGTPC